jgi:hypothetical protein
MILYFEFRSPDPSSAQVAPSNLCWPQRAKMAGMPKTNPPRARPPRRLRPPPLAIYGWGYSSRGCKLRWSEVRSGSFGIDWGPVWGPLGPQPAPNQPQTTPTGPWTTSNCSHTTCSHIHRSATSPPTPRDLRKSIQFHKPATLSKRAGILLRREVFRVH